MQDENDDLHGNAPDTASTALLIIDMINDMEFEGGDALFAQAEPVAKRIARLKARVQQAELPVIYANDNFGRWRSDFREVIKHCTRAGVRGEPIVQMLLPHTDDYFVLKPKHSAFFASTLDILLRYLRVRNLILVGVTGDFCVLFTAHDAYMRDFNLYVPADCVASIDPEQNAYMLGYMERTLKVDIRPSGELDLQELAKSPLAAQF
jgi:nicotinamidase-related amidase